MSEAAAHLVALAQLPGVGPATLSACHRGRGALAAWSALVRGAPRSDPDLAELIARIGSASVERVVAAARALEPATELARHLADGRQVLVEGEPGYPARLADDPAPPAVLFATGDLRALDRPTVAVVGTRNATRPGRDLARSWSAELTELGASVVSGLALGIDGAAHAGVVAARTSAPVDSGPGAGVGPAGCPVGVIASGLDIAYPRRHAELHRQVEAHGLLLSETPLGFRPVAWRFPARNRIIAGLADAVLVVESRSSGGSLLTVAEALQRDTTVLAVPGHPSAPAAAGTNDLLFDGATIARSVADVADAIGLARPAAPRAAGEALVLEPAERAVLGAIGDTPAALAEVVARSKLPLDQVGELLVRLEARQLVVRTGGWYERSAPWADDRWERSR